MLKMKDLMEKLTQKKKHSRELEATSQQCEKVDCSDYIRKIFNEEVYAEYAGGTLTFKMNNQLQLVSLSSEDRNENELYWAAMCYLKYKGSGHSLPRAYEILSHYKDARTAKLMLTI